MKQLIDYFTKGIVSSTLETFGVEVETQFVDRDGRAITTQTSQKMFGYLAEHGWSVQARKGNLIVELVDKRGNKISYELGRHNVEVSTAASSYRRAVPAARDCLEQIYKAGRKFGAKPYFGPILETNEDLLVIPDERDAIWLQLDGREALTPLARTSSVQFTISVNPGDGISILNRFGRNIGSFLREYPQDEI